MSRFSLPEWADTKHAITGVVTKDKKQSALPVLSSALSDLR